MIQEICEVVVRMCIIDYIRVQFNNINIVWVYKVFNWDERTFYNYCSLTLMALTYNNGGFRKFVMCHFFILFYRLKLHPV